MIDRLFTTSCTIKNPGEWETDEDGNSQPATSTATTRCHVQPFTSSSDDEEVAGALDVTPRYRWWGPIDTVITAESTLTIDGQRYKVNGHPAEWRPPTSRQGSAHKYAVIEVLGD